MLKVSKLPLLFLCVGSLLGVFLRWQFMSPTTGINYSFFLHGHSHVMFLGWIFNALYIGFTANHIADKDLRIFKIIFYALQVLVVGMLVSFPLQGYGLFSIIFSTLHTIAAIIFAILFWRRTRHDPGVSAWYARMALVFFVISTAGPFSLGYLMAQHLGQSSWYYFAIYFYLHFQYNGFFLFGAFSLVFNLLEKKRIQFDVKQARTVGVILVVCCVPTYLLSVLWAKPGGAFNVLAGVAGLFQFAALGFLGKMVASRVGEIKRDFSKLSKALLLTALAAFAMKLVLQLLSAIPFIAQMAYELRPVVIAYLHLVLVGVISLVLLVWYFESGLISHRKGMVAMIVFLASFAGMEISLILSPWWSKFVTVEYYSSSRCLFVFAAFLSMSCFLLFTASLRRGMTKVSP